MTSKFDCFGPGFFAGFFKVGLPKKPGGFFWVRAWVSEPWTDAKDALILPFLPGAAEAFADALFGRLCSLLLPRSTTSRRSFRSLFGDPSLLRAEACPASLRRKRAASSFAPDELCPASPPLSSGWSRRACQFFRPRLDFGSSMLIGTHFCLLPETKNGCYYQYYYYYRVGWVRFNVPPHIIGHSKGKFLQVKRPNQQCQSTEGR